MNQSKNTLLLVLIAVVAVFAVLSLLSMVMMGGWGGMMGQGMMGWSQWGRGFGWSQMMGGGLFFLLFLGLIILGLYYLVSDRGVSEPRDRSLDMLRERYAKGEINEEEYKKMKEQLRG